MSAKTGKKGKKVEKNPQPASSANLFSLVAKWVRYLDKLELSSVKPGLDEPTLEYFEAKVRDLTEKNARVKLKCEELIRENEISANAQTKFNHDKQDIVEFLNIKVSEHEKMISVLESKAHQLEKEKQDYEIRTKSEMSSLKSAMQSELETMQTQCTKYKAELSELTAFSAKKKDLELQVIHYKTLLEKKECEYRDTIHNIERKVLQDKNQMKREMLQKVNEAVANFRRVADQQMAETTKRAIRENMAITSQLKKMSSKTIELIAENDSLSTKMKRLRINNSLLSESEQELVKRNQANQRVIKMLVEKLKESDQMLELAFESEQVEPSNDFSKENTSDGHQMGGVEYLTEDMKEEIEALQYDYNILAARLTEVANVTDEMELTFGVNSNALQSEQVFSDKIEPNSSPPQHDTQERIVENNSNLETFPQTSASRVDNIKESHINVEDSPSNAHGQDDRSDDEPVQNGSDSDSIEDRCVSFPPIGPTSYTCKVNTDGNSDNGKSGQNQNAEMRSNRNRRNMDQVVGFGKVHMTGYQKRVEKNYMNVIAKIPSKYTGLTIVSDSGRKDVGVQTKPLPFGQTPTSQYLLGELRPWGAVARCLPRSGVRSYQARPVVKSIQPESFISKKKSISSHS
ncbi:hypothetical protein BATDEDRAFT_26925 [Batrachochytrium dendrobatidis JAM81]|uniref:Cilia- and flagella-associated protein 157 n=1 Tax=Batrachochytrium dendrobatidis (strain JAM81 / FGSC 10211) TaxID=684364 RepID=F4P9J6_BATDJ|nr:uncharacterized protein BATDEDRAFT_26925 [Batrachochytrium dendrobatidis JAM81]EGF78330.1 hypothetical protein BATDEDRAFT_26925 [Batrachochytrium dendrobatidis JAM81]|eukprot:XP_006681090.1 hypothetical protein BATDEDRAFT_26925 [Batrachochytrium dendrobatidis JAM81]